MPHSTELVIELLYALEQHNSTKFKTKPTNIGKWPSSKENNRTELTMQRVFNQHLPSAQARVLAGCDEYKSLTHLTMSNCNIECLANLDSFPSLKVCCFFL